MIGFGIVTAQRQFQSSFAGERTVTRARIATGPRQHRDDVIAKTPGERLFRLADGDLHCRLFTVYVCRDDCFAVAGRAGLPLKHPRLQ